MNGLSRRDRRRCIALLIAAGAACAGIPLTARAQDSLLGSNIALKSNGQPPPGAQPTLSNQGYLGTYLVVPAGGATVKLTANATAAAGAPVPHMNLVIADSINGFTVNSTSASNYVTPNFTLPAGTYFIRTERDYAGNSGGTGGFTLNNLSVATISGSAATFSNSSTDANARNAANTYIENFRKGSATVALSGPSNIPLLPGTPIQADLGRHAFNFGTAVGGNTPTEVNSYLGSNGTALQTNFQAKLNQNFNAVVPGNAGKWQNNEFTRDVQTMSGVDQILNYAQSHNMRARMHNLLWGKNSFNGQQPGWVLNNSNNGLLDQTNNAALTPAARDTARADLRGEISERINYYLTQNSRASKMVEMDVYNESVHEPEYTQGLGYDNVDGIASIHNEAAAAAPNVKMFTNEYNIFQDSYNPVGGAYQAFNNWYLNEVASIRDAGGNVGGIGAQYYPNTSIGTGNNQHSASRMYAVWQNMATHGVSMALTEFGVKAGGEAIAPTVLDDSMRLTFGTPNATGFMMWGFWAGEGLFAPGSPLYNTDWTITETGKRWQDLLGIQDWDGNPNNAWDTNIATNVNVDGTITFTGFYGDYYLRGQTAGLYDVTLAKGTGAYSVNMTAPPTWSMWNPSVSGNWSTASNWATGGVANVAGQTAYFGNSSVPRTLTVDAPRTVGMLAFDSAAPYSITGANAVTLQGFDNATGHRAAIYVAAGSHAINAPLILADDTTVTVRAAGDTLTVSNLQPTVKSLAKSGLGTLVVNNVRGAALNVEAGTFRVAINGSASGASKIDAVAIAAGARLDLNNNMLISETVAGNAIGGIYDGMQGLVQSGRNGGTWDGDGIVTTMPDAAGGLTSIGVATGAELHGLGAGDTSTFAGQIITAASTIAMYTYSGDANLDGLISGDDYSAIDFNATTPGADGWYNGDFNYDGIISGDDYSTIDFNIVAQGTPFSTASQASALTAVPEPASVGLALISLTAGGVRRRRPARSSQCHS